MDQVKGMLMGCFLGDSMGAPYEFQKNTILDLDTKSTGILTGYSRLRVSERMKGKTSIDDYTYYPPGTVTDDSEMTICLLTSLFKNETIEQRARRYYDWIKKGDLEFGDGAPMGLGKNTQNVFKYANFDKSYSTHFGTVHSEGIIYDSFQSNGCLMRASPLILKMDDPNLFEIILNDVTMTNPSTNSIVAVQLYVIAGIYAFKGYEPLFILDTIKEICSEYSEFVIIMNCVMNENVYPASREDKIKGWVCVGFYYAMLGLYLASKKMNYQEIVTYIVNCGGDTDTNGAIAGALLGAYFGLDKMLENNITLNNFNVIISPSTGKSRFRRVPIEDWNIICDRAKDILSL